MAAKEADTEEIPGHIQQVYLVDAQAAQDYATYIVTLGENELQETNLNPLVTQLLAHAQDLRMKAKEKVTMTTMPW